MWGWIRRRKRSDTESNAGSGGGLANYRVERRIGQGAAAQVFLAQDRRNGRWVALKLLELGASPATPEWHDALERFRREATVLHSLHHPGIVAVRPGGCDEMVGGGEELVVGAHDPAAEDSGRQIRQRGELLHHEPSSSGRRHARPDGIMNAPGQGTGPQGRRRHVELPAHRYERVAVAHE